jgi:hypothetical protein
MSDSVYRPQVADANVTYYARNAGPIQRRPPMTATIRMSLAVVGVCIVALLGGPASPAQSPELPVDIPGTYAARECVAAPFPAALPTLEAVLDSAALVAALQTVEIRGRNVFGLRLGALEAEPRVRVLEGRASRAVATAVDAAIGPIPPDRLWSFRLIVAAEDALRVRLERSRVCGGTPSRRLRAETRDVRGEELERIRREIDESREKLRQRRSMVHRVLVDDRGRPLAVELARSSGDRVMDADEARMLRRGRFAPTKLDDVPVAAWIELSGDFGLPASIR